MPEVLPAFNQSLLEHDWAILHGYNGNQNTSDVKIMSICLQRLHVNG